MHIWQTILHGVVIVLPSLLSLYIAYWGYITAEALIAQMVKKVGLAVHYVPGLGFIVALFLLYLVGLLTTRWLGAHWLIITDATFRRIPILKSVYGMTRDLTKQFSKGDQPQAKQPVLVKFAEFNLLGLITSTNFNETLKILAESGAKNSTDSDLVLVYFPMSYQIGGYSALVSRSQLTILDLTFEDLMRFILTAGVSNNNE